MNPERRTYPRLITKGLSATIKIIQPSAKAICIGGDIMDISYSGIKIKLHEAFAANIEDDIIIQFTLPKSGIPVTIKGTVKHRNAELEYGLHYSGNPIEGSLDDLMFECIKYTPEFPLHQSSPG